MYVLFVKVSKHCLYKTQFVNITEKKTSRKKYQATRGIASGGDYIILITESAFGHYFHFINLSEKWQINN